MTTQEPLSHALQLSSLIRQAQVRIRQARENVERCGRHGRPFGRGAWEREWCGDCLVERVFGMELRGLAEVMEKGRWKE